MRALPNDPTAADGSAVPVDSSESRPGQPPPGAARPVAVLDMGSSSIRLLVAEATPGEPIRLLEEASRGVLLGRETCTNGRIGAATMEAALKALEGLL